MDILNKTYNSTTMKANRLFKGAQLAMMCTAALVFSTGNVTAAKKTTEGAVKVSQRFVHNLGANPYLPLWEHVPDGEPHVFEDPDHPGKYRAYIIGSHDTRFGSYCGPDIRMWSAPIEDLNSWRDEGPIFTYQASNGRWDTMYAPDMAEVIEKDEKGKPHKVYYLYPHSRGPRREAMVCKGDRPDGPFTPLNLDEQGAAVQGSCIGFDPSVFIEKIEDKNDPDYSIGFRAYAYWGFQHSTFGQLDQKTMYTVREPRSENLIDPFLPVGSGQQRQGRGGQQNANPAPAPQYAIAEGQKASDFNFFEASSIRKVGNKYVMIFSGHSGTEYGLGSTNSALRYCYADAPSGPWYSGGVAVDSRGVTLSQDGSRLMTSNFAHNTHGSIQQIGDQWYIFYHRPPRGFGNARQSMVAPVSITWDEKPCSEGGKVVLRGMDVSTGKLYDCKAANGNDYTGAEVTSEGFNVYGLPPYNYYSAGYACFFTNGQSLQDTWDIWSNEMVAEVKIGDIIGYKYFGLGGLKKDANGVKAFEGTTSKEHSSFNVWLQPKCEGGITVKVMMDGPWANDTWKGKEIGKIKVPSTADRSKVNKYTIDVSEFVDDVEGKHAIYLIFDGAIDGDCCTFYGCGFSSTKSHNLKRPVPPTLTVTVGGKEIELPSTPVRSTEQNGYVDNTHYEMDVTLEPGQKKKVAVECLWPTMQFWIEQAKEGQDYAIIKSTYLYPGTTSEQTKIYKINFK